MLSALLYLYFFGEAREKMAELVVFDFETTGMKPELGARVIEIGAVRLEAGRVTAHFQSLVHPGCRVGRFIAELTGISDAMLKDAPPAAEVFPAFLDFVGKVPLIAHNARFDLAFLRAELARLGLSCDNPHACSLLAARRILPEAPRYRLSVLAEHCGIAPQGTWHRALADAEAAARLWLFMTDRLRRDYGFTEAPFALMRELTGIRRAQAPAWLADQAARQKLHKIPN